MTSGNEKSFTIIWKIENASYCMQKDCDYISSPAFTVDELHETSWKLEVGFSLYASDIAVNLRRLDNEILEDDVYAICEFAFLAADDTVLHCDKDEYFVPSEGDDMGNYCFALRDEVFRERRSAFLPQDTLTTRCRILKSEGGMSKNVQYFARTCIGVEKRSFFWNIEKFPKDLCFPRPSNPTHEIKSLGSGKKLMSFELFLSGGLFYDEAICIKIIPDYQNSKNSTVRLSIVDSSKNTVKCLQDEFLAEKPYVSKDFVLCFTRKELIEKKSVYLPDDVLSLLCECTFSFGIVLEEIKMANFDCTLVANREMGDSCWLKENDLPLPKSFLIDNLKSMLNNSCLSDVNLKTKNQTYPAHKCILSARSPVFKAMFSTDMKENKSNCVDIEDLNDDTVSCLLHYIYTAEVGELDLDTATKLYEAADKYQILDLRDVCSSYLKNNLGLSSACKLLVLADLHQDKDLKGFVQDFILRKGRDIINSEEWEQLMVTNVKLAAETMHLKFKM